jgi:O-antigen ligase
VLFILWILFQILRGIGIYQQQAIGDGRRFLTFIFTMAIVLCVRKKEDIFFVLKSLAYSSLVLSILVIGRLANIIPHDASAQQLYLRVLPAGAVLFLLYSFVFILLNQLSGNPIKLHTSAKYFGFACIALVLVTQHRSVWLAAFVAMALILLIFRKTILSRIVPYGVTFLVIIFVILFMTVSNESKIVQHISNRLTAFYNPLSDETSAFRLTTWKAQLSDIQSHPVLGSGFGGYYRWTYRGHTKHTSPHNLYFDILLKLGVIGLVLYLLFLSNVIINLFFHTIGLGDRDVVLKYFLISVIATQFYFFAYSIDFIQCVLFGLALSWANMLYQKQNDPGV